MLHHTQFGTEFGAGTSSFGAGKFGARSKIFGSNRTFTIFLPDRFGAKTAEFVRNRDLAKPVEYFCLKSFCFALRTLSLNIPQSTFVTSPSRKNFVFSIFTHIFSGCCCLQT